jgi:cellulase/cellobiase CelA1
VSGICQPACDDGAKNGNETDVDCGGSCADCRPGQHCTTNGDCLSGVCASGTCSSDQLIATLTVHSDWSTGFCGMISLQNVRPQATITWMLGVNFEGSVLTSSSGGEFSPPSGGGNTTITPPSWGHVIWPSSFHTISFCATKTSSNYFPELLFTNVSY